MSKLRLNWRWILDVLFPVYCLGCGQEGDYLCDDCLAGVKSFADQKPQGVVDDFLDGLVCATSYNDELVKKALHFFKYQFVPDIGQRLSLLAGPQVIPNDWRDAYIVPVPLHAKRQRWRDFNQAEILARFIASQNNLKYDSTILQRVKYRTPQMKLDRSQRLVNTKDVFTVSLVAGHQVKKVILVDDVVTTGATLNEAARSLKQSGVKKVYGLTIAHG